MAIRNKRPGTCAHCGTRVREGAGWAYKPAGASAWLVACSAARCTAAAGITVAAQPAGPARTLRQGSGELLGRAPYDAAALPLWRAMPGARWVNDAKAWSISAAPRDRARVLELADRLGLDVEASLRTVERDEATQAACARAQDARLYPFQRAGVEFLAARDRALLSDDMGLGKTLQAIMALPAATEGRVMVVCPAAIKHNWAAEFARWRPEYRVSVLEGKKAFRAPEAGEVVVVNYDVLPAYLVAKKSDEGVYAHETPTAMVEALAGVSLVCDEAHAVKNYKAARSQKVATLVRLVARAWLLTGTPLLTRPSDLWGLLSAGGLAGEVFGSFARFMALFGAVKGRYGIEWGSPSPEVPERLRRAMMRRMKAEVLPDLPAKTHRDLSVPVNAQLAAMLDAAYEQWAASEDAAHGEGAGRRKPSSLPTFSEFSAVRAELAAAKVEALLDFVAEHEEQEVPLLVFSAHRAPIDALATREGWATITGDTSSEERARIVADFQRGALRGVGLTIQAGGVGLTLTRASNVLFVDLDWTPALNCQAEDRVVRIGQTATSVLITRLVCAHPMDRHVADLIAAKMKLIEAAVEAEIKYVPAADRRSNAVTEAVLATMREAQAKADREEALAKVARIAAREQAKMPRTQTEPLTAERAAAIREALSALAGACDGAKTKDEAGFNRADAYMGHWLAATGLDDETSLRTAWAIVARYPRQVAASYPVLF